MREQGLVSTYTVAQFKPHTKSCNESEQKNELNREFDQEKEMKAIVSDLTYVRVNRKWHYVCVFVDLFNREIVGFCTGPNKDTLLVYRAFASMEWEARKTDYPLCRG
ncbi:DDE-type integrase/transposase/recombinase [Anaerobacillus sp. MEB173]|uniref:DDE-type integrase/transposase/recombinase n=1 Tax=Anaerobacillus sp. MEB173 TaxID=3383345 RepID=UPI003F8F62B5